MTQAAAAVALMKVVRESDPSERMIGVSDDEVTVRLPPPQGIGFRAEGSYVPTPTMEVYARMTRETWERMRKETNRQLYGDV